MQTRYSTVAMTLHWLIALAIFGLIPAGWWMADAIKDPATQAQAYQVFQMHKSIGLTVLVLTIARLAWRLSHPAPPLPAGMAGWEKFAASATHVGFYAVTLALPLTGWAYVSAGWAAELDRPLAVATSWFGLFEVPHWSVIAGMAEEARRHFAFQAMSAHSLLAWGAIVLAALHIGAALKHQFVAKDNLLGRMIPFFKAGGVAPDTDKPGPLPLIAGLGVIVLLVLVGFAKGGPETPYKPRIVEAASAAPIAPAPVSDAPAATAETPVAAPPVDAPAAPVAPQPSAAPAAQVARWNVDAKASSIGFTGAHAGNAFKGSFTAWTADIRFDPANLASSKAVVTIDTSSARTGDGTQESSLRETEWFNPAQFPKAVFETKSIKSLGGNRYEAQATLTVKGKAVPVTLPFTLTINGATAEMSGTVTLSRKALALGLSSDADGEWVSLDIPVAVKVKAQKAG
jgi:cytochrome b561/polyisoprenoid-binding protein YceI